MISDYYSLKPKQLKNKQKYKKIPNNIYLGGIKKQSNHKNVNNKCCKKGIQLSKTFSQSSYYMQGHINRFFKNEQYNSGQIKTNGNQIFTFNENVSQVKPSLCNSLNLPQSINNQKRNKTYKIAFNAESQYFKRGYNKINKVQIKSYKISQSFKFNPNGSSSQQLNVYQTINTNQNPEHIYSTLKAEVNKLQYGQKVVKTLSHSLDRCFQQNRLLKYTHNTLNINIPRFIMGKKAQRFGINSQKYIQSRRQNIKIDCINKDLIKENNGFNNQIRINLNNDQLNHTNHLQSQRLVNSLDRYQSILKPIIHVNALKNNTNGDKGRYLSSNSFHQGDIQKCKSQQHRINIIKAKQVDRIERKQLLKPVQQSKHFNPSIQLSTISKTKSFISYDQSFETNNNESSKSKDNYFLKINNIPQFQLKQTKETCSQSQQKSLATEKLLATENVHKLLVVQNQKTKLKSLWDINENVVSIINNDQGQGHSLQKRHQKNDKSLTIQNRNRLNVAQQGQRCKQNYSQYTFDYLKLNSFVLSQNQQSYVVQKSLHRNPDQQKQKNKCIQQQINSR